MRVVMLITSYHPIVGGAERQLAQVAGLMRDAGVDVHVVTRIHRGLAAEETVDGVPVHRVGMAGAPKPLAAAAFLVGAVRRAAALKPDVLHCHSTWSPAMAGMIAKRLTGAPLLAKPMRGGEVTKLAGAALGLRRIAALARGVDRFVVISREIDDELEGFGVPPGRRVFIPNGVDLSRFEPADAAGKAALRARLGLPPDAMLAVFAGRFSVQKRLPLLLDAWADAMADVAQDGSEALLLIAGADRSAEGEADVVVPPERLRAPNVRALGHVADMPALLRAADVFVLPSASEGLSNALLEACACGLAAVASRTGGTTDVIESGRNGLLFDIDDRAGLTAALRRLRADAVLRSALGRAARDTVATAYDLRATASSLVALYRSLGAAA
jgi:glycosyltransferase involved in cell wall biosynthesis